MRRTLTLLPVCAGLLALLPLAIGSDYYINLTSQILIAAQSTLSHSALSKWEHQCQFHFYSELRKV